MEFQNWDKFQRSKLCQICGKKYMLIDVKLPCTSALICRLNSDKKSKDTSLKLFHDGVHYHIETSLLICRTNEWTGFCMIGTSFIQEIKTKTWDQNSSLSYH